MRLTSASGESVESNSAHSSIDATSRLERLARITILGLGFIVIVETITRYLESLGPATAVDDVRRRRGKSTPGAGSRIEIDDEETTADSTAEERSAEAIDERASSDTDEPPSPGEMAIDEDVVDELRESDGDSDDRER